MVETGMQSRILERFNRGDLAQAYELCLAGLREAPEDLWLRHRAVLCLIRSGALERAEEEYGRYRLADAVHNEDCLALGARLMKARAMELDGEEFAAMAAASSQKYAQVYEETEGHYPAVNAASTALLAGDRERARTWAERVLDRCGDSTPGDAESAYYQLASQAEAHLILGDTGAAHLALRCAIAKDPENFSAHVTTLRQLRTILPALKLRAPWLDDLHPPRPAHFAGHLFRLGAQIGAMSAGGEADLSAAIADALDRENIGSLYGALAAGADIMVAEAGLHRGSELHVVIPVPVNVFIVTSVRPLGLDWVRRCEACLGEATAIHEVTSDRKLLSELHLRFASEVAMGLARMRAGMLATAPLQILVSDGRPGRNAFGTAHDAQVWAGADLPQVVLPFDPSIRYRATEDATAPRQDESRFRQVLRAMLFVDVRGSSAIPDDRIPAFVEQVLGRLTACCDQLDPAPVYSDSWGDGLFLAFGSVSAAARAADALQRAFAEIDLEALDLPDVLALRVGGHYGPVHEGEDPLQKRLSLFGGQVAMASRIEGCAMPGSVFVSEPFAAGLAMSGDGEFRCEYVGQTKIDPHLPDTHLYSLRTVAPGSPASREFAGQLN